MPASTYGRQVVLALTNKSGGSVAAGDVVIVDTTNNDAFTTTTTGAFTGTIGIAQETIASNATGRVLLSGYAALVNVNASVTRGNYGKTHTVVKQATDAGASRIAGTFCQFLTGGTTPDAVVFASDLSSGSGMTNPMTTTADMIYSSSGSTPARLAAGAAGGVVAMGNGVPIWNAGTSFPGSKATNDRYWRTDLGLEFYWDGTRWLSAIEYAIGGNGPSALIPTTTAPVAIGAFPSIAAFDYYFTKATFTSYVVTTNTGSAYWTFAVRRMTSGNTITNAGTADTSADAADTWVRHTITINAAASAGTYLNYDMAVTTKTGAPGTLYVDAETRYRLIGV